MAQEEERTPGAGRRAAAQERIDPIYRRLPRGPHSLDGAAIRAHQRARIQGALVRAVALSGYDAFTVREVVGLAGVSRRSFYEQFENRHDCFLRTARALAERALAEARRACSEAGPSPGAPPRAAIAAITSVAAADPQATRLVLAHTLTAGEAGASLRSELLGVAARMLGAALTGAEDEALPAPVLRVLAALLAATLERAACEPRGGAEAAARTMSSIARGAALPAAGAATVLSESLQRGARRAAALATAPPRTTGPGDPAERIMGSALRLAAQHPVDRLSAPQIADAAGVPVDAVMSGFGGRDGCIERALEVAGARLLAIATRAGEVADGETQSVRLALAGVLGHLAANPDVARGLALVAHRAGPSAGATAERLHAELGRVLMRGARAGSPPPEAAGAAVMELVRHALLEGRERLLPALSDQAAYALLAPGFGAARAIEAISAGASDARRSA